MDTEENFEEAKLEYELAKLHYEMSLTQINLLEAELRHAQKRAVLSSKWFVALTIVFGAAAVTAIAMVVLG